MKPPLNNNYVLHPYPCVPTYYMWAQKWDGKEGWSEKLIHLKTGVERELYGHPGCQKGEQVGPRLS